MFTGLIQEVGTVESIERDEAGARVRVAAELASELAEGDSVAVAGVCLTAVAVERTPRREARSMDAESAAPRVVFDAMNQTLSLTTLGSLAAGGRVNLEPPLRASDRLGGHLVQGHVDGVGTVSSAADDGISRRLEIDLPAGLGRYVVSRGSIAVDGVSLTVAAVGDEAFEVALIPETLERTTLGEVGEGDRVNLEVDLIARHVERLMQGFGEGSD